MELWLLNKNKKINLTNIVTDVSTTGNYANCCRTCSFGLPMSQSDKRTHIIDIKLGDTVQLIHNNINIFTGIIWNIPKQTNSSVLNILCKNYGIYLKKNSGFYKFNCTAEQAVEHIAKDFNIELGHIEKTNIKVKRNFFGNNLYDIIMTMYSLANDKKYYIKFDSNKLSVYEKGKISAKSIIGGKNLLTLSYCDTLDNFTNKVYVYDENNIKIDEISNDDEINKYGILSEFIQGNKEYKTQAKKLLENDYNQELTVQVLGDNSYCVGCSVIVEEPYTKTKGLFYINEDSHIFKNSLYTNSLKLSFKNLMDEKEVGS